MPSGRRLPADEGMAGREGVSEIVEKVMSISRPEFEAGLKRLAGRVPDSNGQGGYVLSDVGAERQTVLCAFEALPSAVLGALLKLPCARIQLDLTALSSDARRDFVELFERTFQRGGG